MSDDDIKITCQICNAQVHSIRAHIRDDASHTSDGWTIERYKCDFPDAPVLSPKARRFAEEVKAKSQKEEEKTPMTSVSTGDVSRKHFHEVFSLGKAKAAMSSLGRPIEIAVHNPGADDEAYIAAIDPNYVFNIDLTKKVIIGLEMAMPVYLWGYHGTGKTTLFEQTCARTGRPFMRVQHTATTEESHIVGQYVAHEGSTKWQEGPLMMAMRLGYVYCADEYDFAMPGTLAVYQPVLEGKPLVVKEAPPEHRITRPHPNFRFVGTGNTNGGGDESGLYQGTLIQNAANYSRFPITEEVTYMDKDTETAVVSGQGGIEKQHAEKLVKIANMVRDAFRESKISTTVSPRELIHAAKLGLMLGADWKAGLRLAFSNRLSRVDKEVVEQLCQRVFG